MFLETLVSGSPYGVIIQNNNDILTVTRTSNHTHNTLPLTDIAKIRSSGKN
jgi:hypothetical protein